MIPSTGAILQYWQSQRSRSLQVAPGPSDLGGCERRFAYKLAGYEHTNVASSTVSAMGTAIHEKVAEAAEEINEIKQLGWEIEKTVTFGGLSGTLDLYADETVIDHKTVSENAMDTVKIHGPYLSHRWQIHWYGAGAVQAGLKVKELRINYLNRNSGKELIVPMAFDMRVLAQAAEWKQRIQSTPLDAVPRTYAPGSIFCRNCPFFDDCWGGAVPDRDLRSVQYVDNKDEIMEELYDVRRKIKELKEKDENLKGTLDAIRPDDLSFKVQGSKRALKWSAGYRKDGSEYYTLKFVAPEEPYTPKFVEDPEDPTSPAP